MSIDKIEKSIKYYNELKELDAKIVNLEKIAIECNNGAENLKISLSCDKIKEQKKDDILDCDGSLKNGGIQPVSLWYEFRSYAIDIKTNPSNELKVTETVDQKHFFMFLDYILQKYNQRREFLINKLNQTN